MGVIIHTCEIETQNNKKIYQYKNGFVKEWDEIGFICRFISCLNSLRPSDAYMHQ